ncbi:hypothetical protein QCA50_002315 [Cerrena zonata]|uniref:Protein kinase domain-containing protein n=1 Tax=Cerrena zonata TaxID=2478898 RepID=A0AAW0GYR1_9APHY
MDKHINEIFDPETFGTVAETPSAYVTRAFLRDDYQRVRPLAIKSGSTLPEFSKEPHDIIKELKILSKVSHQNIVELLGHSFDLGTNSLNMWMPFLSHSLANVLDSPLFSPHPNPASQHPPAPCQAADFTNLAKSLIFQLVAGISYLHSSVLGIAHRDIKPGNALLTCEGCLKLIDFGVAWNEEVTALPEVLWPEPSDQMYFDVCTGAYRPPELLFGATSYDPFTVDTWSLGVTCAEFFTPIELCSRWDEEEGSYRDNDEGIKDTKRPFILPRSLDHTRSGLSWSRHSLFDSSRGSIGLAWSIFQIRGTPTDEVWPNFTALPDAQKITFQSTPAVDLVVLLPNLPTGCLLTFNGSHFPSTTMVPSPLDLLQRFLVYPPDQRLKAVDALRHPWFRQDALILPEGYSVDSSLHNAALTVQRHGLPKLLAKYFTS